jgi:hypothetical protein
MSTCLRSATNGPEHSPAWLLEMQKVLEGKPKLPAVPTQAEGPDRGRK